MFLVFLKLLSGKLVQCFVELHLPHGVSDLTSWNVQGLQQESSILILLALPLLPLLDVLLALLSVFLPQLGLAIRPTVPGQKVLL